MFDLKTTPWVIKINSQEEYEAAEKWLKREFGSSLDLTYYDYIAALTNVDADGYFHGKVLYMTKGADESTTRHEIKLSYKQKYYVSGVGYQMVKSKAEQQLETVMDRLAELQYQAEQLQEIIK